MNFAPITAAGPAIQIHLASTSLALVLGIVMLWRPKGTISHKKLGWLWVAAMTLAALSSFWIKTINPGHFGPIHILSVATLLSLFYAIVMIRRGKVQQHRRVMISIFFGGLVLAGIFTLLPNRLLGHLLFG
ncbi:MAG TPA: DUF2306 domain-containing protein [Ferrovibrio sp.]|uniref:DUF2306 domain-containing protein n=1 Tax=Ferrovibrio sp. TaxID=1917215 RepID=UPI002ED11510